MCLINRRHTSIEGWMPVVGLSEGVPYQPHNKALMLLPHFWLIGSNFADHTLQCTYQTFTETTLLRSIWYIKIRCASRQFRERGGQTVREI